MTRRFKLVVVLVASVTLLTGVRLSGQLGSSTPAPDPDLALAQALTADLVKLRDSTGMVAVEQLDLSSGPSLYNSAHILRAMRLTGMTVPRPNDHDLVTAVHAEAGEVDPLWAWEWACEATDDGRIRPPESDAAGVAARLHAVSSAATRDGGHESATSDQIGALVVARCLGLKDAESLLREGLASTRAVTAEQAVRLKDLGVAAGATSTPGSGALPVASSTPSEGCAHWDSVQGPAGWVLSRLIGRPAAPSPCLADHAKGLAEPQALYWLARAGAFDPPVRAMVIGALGTWRSKLLPSGLVAKTPAAQGSLQSSVIAAELFASLGAIAETPPWLRDVFARRSPTITRPTSSGPRSAPEPAEAQRQEDETILVALGCHAIAAACPRVTAAAAEVLRRPLPAEIRTAGQARQWIMVVDARRRLGIDTSERAKVDTSRESWIQRGAVRSRLAATLCEVGQCATAASMGTGEPIEQARQALDADQLELATALLRLKGARQERVSLADLAPVTSRLGRFRAAGTSAMFSWSPGGPPSVAATQAVYDSALALGFSASDLLGAAAAPTTSTPTSGGRS